ncbi:hypothetical protein GLOIN_2v1647723 [Rhizophagus clarus]|uniref:Uncharacterized protein n=1 Tax=Rhizophagus clarus TaxID=94130 RepID=A0A8H3QER1_9GLOM|nr:hypothetical protein GLOIN_2v1647723 [Rhizophagus clarus]
MLSQANITLKKGLYSKQVLNYFHYLKRGFDCGIAKKYIYQYSTTSKNFDNDKKLLYTKQTPSILSIENFLKRKFSTEILNDTLNKNEILLKQSDLNNNKNRESSIRIQKIFNSTLGLFRRRIIQ